MDFSDKTLTELREMAQPIGIADIFQLTREQLVQAISMRQSKANEVNILPESPVIPKFHSARKPEQKEDIVRNALAFFVEKGLHLTISDGRWYMAHGICTDEGSLDVNPKVIFKCARRVMGM